jgi:hypothetical protein
LTTKEAKMSREDRPLAFMIATTIGIVFGIFWTIAVRADGGGARAAVLNGLCAMLLITALFYGVLWFVIPGEEEDK